MTQLKTFVEKLPHMQQAKHDLSKRKTHTHIIIIIIIIISVTSPPLSLMIDTTIAELVKTVTDHEEFLNLIHTEQGIPLSLPPPSLPRHTHTLSFSLRSS